MAGARHKSDGKDENSWWWEGEGKWGCCQKGLRDGKAGVCLDGLRVVVLAKGTVTCVTLELLSAPTRGTFC